MAATLTSTISHHGNQSRELHHPVQISSAMHLIKQFKQYKIETMVIVTILCATALVYVPFSISPIMKPVTVLPALAFLVVCQVIIYRACLRLRQREYTLHQVGRKLVQLKTRQRKDEVLALHILNHINSTNECVPDHANVWQKPLQGFSGDLALAFESQCGRRYTLLADLTGHGIAAAISAAPVASIFRATAHNCLTVAEIVTELNNRLNALLPSGFFCCAAIILDNHGMVTVCNAGLPDLLLTNDDGEIVNIIASAQLPLGIDPITTQDVELFTSEFQQRHQLYAFTDGLTETNSVNDEFFDIDMLSSLISSKNDGSGRINNITAAFESFSKGSEINDDISIVEVMIR